jgi:hypothetical protein
MGQRKSGVSSTPPGKVEGRSWRCGGQNLQGGKGAKVLNLPVHLDMRCRMQVRLLSIYGGTKVDTLVHVGTCMHERQTH